MTKISVINYLGNLRTASRHLQSGEEYITDAPTDNQGKGEAFSPTDLVSTGLGNCMITLMGIAANGNNIPLGEIKAEVQKIMANNPRRIQEIVINFEIEDQNFTPKQKAIIEYAALNCPVAKSLSPDVQQTVSFNYFLK
jgi:putative redox protein